ncbi:MAG TPA: serine/threonine-protein kinase [Abditibacterium sp.]|jgi:serine/threonine-protein kinase
MSALAPQTSLQDGAYVLMGLIGRGGFGITYRARDTQNERDVAIKECFPAGCERQGQEVVAHDFWAHRHGASFRHRFRTQAAQLSRVSHPNLARVFGCFDENGTVYLVMELLDGPNLLDLIERGEISLDEANEWIEKLAGALGALHEGGLLHLDVKPENVVLCDGEPVLLDFDLVQPQGEADLSTRPLSLAMQCGTPGYAPLEQYAQTGKLSPATDFYALGATWYHLITGRAPLSALDRAVETPFRAPIEVRRDLAPHLNGAVLRALEMKPAARPASAQEFLESLRAPASVDDEDFGPQMQLAPQLMKHGTGFHRVVLTTKTPIFPQRCVCCHERADTNWHLISPSGRYELPICGQCQRHQLASRSASFVTLWGSILSLVLAVFVVVLSFVASALWPLLLGPVCIVLNFAALSYGALKSSRAEEMLKDSCCDPLQPATYNFTGQVHIWRFKNGHYAASFRKRNADFVK